MPYAYGYWTRIWLLDQLNLYEHANKTKSTYNQDNLQILAPHGNNDLNKQQTTFKNQQMVTMGDSRLVGAAVC